uniref:Aminoglycoside phosphotransferase domain-containing protein n=1 Tax=Thermofilum pendens TaxID=2269 RepID=A0A7C3SPB5_THEPE
MGSVDLSRGKEHVVVCFEAKRWLRGGDYCGHAATIKVCEQVIVAMFSRGGEEYAVPLVEDQACPRGRGAHVGRKQVCEAEYSELFVNELLSGRCSGLRLEVYSSLRGSAEFQRVLGEEATNPHALYRLGENRVVVKGYRLLRSWNPEPNFLRYLSGKSISPRLHAVYSLSSQPLGVIVEFVEGVDPGGIVYSEALARMRGEEQGRTREVLELISGKLAEFHRLMLSCKESWCAPDVIAETDVERWISRMLFYLDNLHFAPGISAHLRKLVERGRSGLEAYVGSLKLRIHQDFHFSQTLLTRNGNLVIVDFEGEPARPSWCASELEPGLRDLATLLRAISYISFFALREAAGWSVEETVAALSRREELVRRIAEWGQEAVETLVESYLRKTPRSACPASSMGDALEMLFPWILERALYEAHYEREYRPLMVQVALTTLLEEIPPVGWEKVK